MKINELYGQKRPIISMEVFPPNNDADPDGIFETIARLKSLSPDFISVTYSAGRLHGLDATIDIASKIKNKYGIESLAHITCSKLTSDEIIEYIDRLKVLQIENILALRGDLPPGVTREEEGNFFKSFSYAHELIKFIKSLSGEFSVGAAAYPEGHLLEKNMTESIERLKIKEDSGADFFITQLCFDNELFYKFYDLALKRGVKAPISVGIMPILGKNQIQKMIFMCGASLPSKIIKILNRYENDSESLIKAGIDYSSSQIRDLIKNKVDGIHIYTMNRPYIAEGNLEAIGDLL